MRRASIAFLLAVLGVLILAAPAGAAFGLQSLDVTFTDENGAGVFQAGSHPYAMKTTFNVNTEEVAGNPFPQESLKDVELFQIPGFIGDQTAVPRCATLDFLQIAKGNSQLTECADSTVVGLVKVSLSTPEGINSLTSPLYNLEPSPGKAAKLGFVAQSEPVTIDVGASESPPYNLVASSRNVSQVVEVTGAEVTIWGVPADPSHDKERGKCFEGLTSCPAGVNPRPFLTLPRSCQGPLETRYEMDSWQHPGTYLPSGAPNLLDPNWLTGSVLTHDEAVPPNPQGMIGCGALTFGPTTSAQPTSTSAGSAAGIDVGIDVEDEGLKSVEGKAQADIAKVVTRLPVGITANPSAAEGLGACTTAQFAAEALGTPLGGGCPEASKLGTVQAETPILENHPLHGVIYLAQPDDRATPQAGAENPFDSLIAFYLVIRDPELGVFVKLAGKGQADPQSGQITTTFEGLPPYPLSHVDVHLRSGPRAPLITPRACGTFATEMQLTPSSGAPALASSSTFTIGSGAGGAPCPVGPPPFHPGFEAGSLSNAAGTYSPFSLRLTRQDGEQELTRFSATLPPGVTARIAGVAKCPDAAIAAAKAKTGRQELASPSCPAASQVGHLLGGAGVGAALTYVPGSLYLAGPYNGDPLSVVAIVPALAGPFDVGTVVTRVALNLNPTTFRAEVDGSASDPIPHILEGLPLEVRDLRVYTDRPGFTLNPTSCTPTQTAARIFGSGADLLAPTDDAPFSASSRYQAASCASLAFKPKLSLSLKGGTKRNDHPALRSTVSYPKGSYANIGKAVVTLPHSEFIDPNHINNPCTRVQFNANQCPPSSILGTARATSPLLDEPLEGPVYFRSNGGERKVPDIVADLHGLFRIILIGKVDSKNARIRTTFDQVPDAPVSSFVLNLKGGKKHGVLVNSANLCAQKRRAVVQLTGQNGRRYDTEPVIATSCKTK
jgi:hypothetical protein